jgi:hypothetical protein
MPPSLGANKKITEFANQTFDSSAIPIRHAALLEAARKKAAEYNPENYQRPDIMMSLRRHRWSEVAAVGLEDLSYFSTTIGALDKQCPGLLTEQKRDSMLGYAISASREATQRIMRGEASSPQEAQRAVMLGLNTLFNQPGCRVNRWGGVVSCTTEEQFSETNRMLMTSGPAQSDMGRLIRHGCDNDEVRGYLDAAVAFASRSPMNAGAPAIP